MVRISEILERFYWSWSEQKKNVEKLFAQLNIAGSVFKFVVVSVKVL